jgi:hypothetical protein
MRRVLLVSLFLVGVLVPQAGDAQFLERLTNPDVSVTLEHPPSLPLQVTTLAFGPPRGECSEALHDRIEVELAGSGMDIVDRSHLDSVLSEHKLQVSGLVNEATAAQVGAMLGAQALVFVNVRHCDVDRGTTRHTCYKGKTQYPCTKYHTRADINGSLRVVDLSTGRFLAAQPISGTSAAESWDGYPDSDEQLQQAEGHVVTAVQRMFMPWNEQRELVFYNDKECELKTAYLLLRGGDVEGARQASLDNLEVCRSAAGVKPKTLSHAYYNVGMTHFIRNDYEKAQEYFREAMSLRGGEIVAAAMSECRQAQQLADAMTRYEEDQSVLLAELSASAAGGAAAEKAAPVAAEAGSVADRLRKLDGLLEQGLINQEEYDEKRATILSDL